MEIPVFDVPTLPPHQLETHEIKRTPPSDTPRLLGAWVERRSDGVRDGREVWWYATGAPFQLGERRDGARVGTWYTMELDGLRYETETARADGCFDVQRFVRSDREAAWTLAATGLRVSAAGDSLRDHGWWTFYPAGKPPYQVEYRRGHAIRSRPTLDQLRDALDRGDVRRAFELSSYGDTTLYFGLEDLEGEGFVISPTVLPALVERTMPHLLSFLLPSLRLHAATLLPVFEEQARQLVARDFRTASGVPDTFGVARLPILLSALQLVVHGTPLDAQWDALLGEALVANERQVHGQEVIELLTAVVRELPMERREALVLQQHVRRKWVHGDVLWTYAATAPSPVVLERSLAAIAAMDRQEFSDKDFFRYDSVRERCVRLTLAVFGDEAIPRFERWLASEGNKAPQRALVLATIADACVPEAAGTLLAFAVDSLDPARLVARDGLLKLGARARPALEAAAAGKNGKLRTVAAALLEDLSLVSRRSVPESIDALAALRASISEEAWANFAAITRLRHAEFHAEYREALATDAPRAFVAFHDLAVRDHTNTIWQRLDFDQNASALRYHLDKHPGLPALLAERLYRLPRKPASRALIEETLSARAIAVLEPLGYLYEGSLPLAADDVAAHVGRTFPWEGRRLLLACAASERTAVRAEAVAGLVRCGAQIVPEVVPLLGRRNDGPLAAAEVLQALPQASAIAPLEAAIAAETRDAHRDALKKALAACRSAKRRGGG